MWERKWNKLQDSFLKAGPEAAKEIKKLLFAYADCVIPDDIEDLTCKTISRVRVGDEGQEGMTALLEKRKPQWVK